MSGKPSPEIYIKAAKLLNLPVEACIGVEDSINGIISVYKSGMRAIMIPDLEQPTFEISSLLYAKLDSLLDLKYQFIIHLVITSKHGRTETSAPTNNYYFFEERVDTRPTPTIHSSLFIIH